MTLIEDFTPLVSGPWLRALAIWMEVCTAVLFGVTFNIISLISLCITGAIALPLNIFLVIRRQKLRKAARVAGVNYEFEPKVWVIVLDFILAFLYLASFVLLMLGGYYSRIFTAFAYIGALSIAHVHLFFASFETDMLRRLKRKNRVSQVTASTKLDA